MRLFLFFLLLVTMTFREASAQKISKRTGRIVAKIAAVNEVHCKGIGFGRVPSEQYKNYQRLGEIATQRELYLLTEHPNATVRCYAFQRLANKSGENLLSLFIKHVADNEGITTFCGCVHMSNWQSVGDYILQVVTPGNVFSAAFTLGPEARMIVDSVLIFQSGITLRARQILLATIKPRSEKYYDRIRQIVVTEKNDAALIALARYQRTSDIPLIKSQLENSLDEQVIRAAGVFPDTTFYPLLIKKFEAEVEVEYFNYQVMEALYKALARYPYPETKILFKRSFSVKEEYRRVALLTFLAVALEKYPDSYFDDIKKEIHIDENQRAGMNLLLERD